MTTNRRADANRKNAKASTGPRTPGGKAVVARNSLRHGLTARALVLPGEDADELEALSGAVHADLRPVGAVEDALVERIVAACWRLARLERVEVGLFAVAYHREQAANAREAAVRFGRDYVDPDVFGIGPVAPERRCDAAAALVDAAMADEAANAVQHSPARAWENNVEPFMALARYEAGISRELQRARHELERRQAKRLGQHVPAPVALDVTVEGDEG